MKTPFPKEKSYPKRIYFSNECYQIKFVKRFPNPRTCAETCWAKKIIKIKSGMSPRETFSAIIHELLHVIEFEGPVKLKHKVVYKLEKFIFELLVDNFL